MAIKYPSLNDLPSFGKRLSWAIEQNSAFRNQADLARALKVTPPYITALVAKQLPPGKTAIRRLSEALAVPEAWLAYGVVPADGDGDPRMEEETAEQAIAESAAVAALRSVERTVRAVGGWDAVPVEERPKLLTTILLDEMDDWEAAGWETKPLRDLIRKVSRGDFE